MRQLTIAIDCGETRCWHDDGHCDHCWRVCRGVYVCRLFQRALSEDDDGEFQRLPECLAAEVPDRQPSCSGGCGCAADLCCRAGETCSNCSIGSEVTP